MAEKTVLEVVPGRRHIIKRPRLTRLLDETPARIILLVAPAGYGKTTLAREWLADRRHVWYRATPASSDVASLSAELSEVASAIVAGAGERMRARLGVTDAPEHEADVLAELLSEDLAAWPDDAWIGFDDYHQAMDSAASETFVDRLVSETSLRLLFTSRRRPTWATARRILYGEIAEFGRTVLSMSHDEADEVLRGPRPETLPGLVALAEGWPAVIGLASYTGDIRAFAETLPHALYDFFAEELYQAASPETKAGLKQLSLLPPLTPPLVHSLLRGDAPKVIEEASHIGFLSPEPHGALDLHPLLRAFLTAKVAEQPRAATDDLIKDVSEFLFENSFWDDVFVLIERFCDPNLLLRLIEEAGPTQVRAGRLETVTRWLRQAHEIGVSSPAVDLIEAEMALRHGLPRKAEALAASAAEELDKDADGPLLARALLAGGTSAHLSDRYELAATYFRKAASMTLTPEQSCAALWGLFLALHYLEDDESSSVLAFLRPIGGETASGRLRLAHAEFHDACRTNSPLRPALDLMSSALHLLPKVSDPHAANSFMQSYAHALMLTGRYKDAVRTSEQGLEVADRHRIEFVKPIAHCVQAFAATGLRQFRKASELIDLAHDEARRLGDLYNLVNAATARAKLLLSQGRFADAASVTDREWQRLPSRSLYGEFLAIRALALASLGESDDAARFASEAERTTRSIEARTPVRFTRLVADEVRGRSISRRRVEEAFKAAVFSGHADGVVLVCRCCPPLLERLPHEDKLLGQLARILTSANDHRLARTLGLPLEHLKAPSDDHGLSAREKEVFALLSQGKSNRQIAHRLFISEATVKVHVGRILRKLDARSRVEAALKAVDVY